jgi:hypothetical protein
MTSSRVEWRLAAIVAFGATAVLAVTLSRGSMSASLAARPGSQSGSPGVAARAVPDARHAADIPPCEISRLRITLRAGGRAGQFLVDFTNVSGPACSLRGYPSVSAYGAGERELGAADAHDTSGAAARLVVLSRGKSAVSPVAATAPSLPASRCRPVTAAGLRVVPPGEHAGRFIRRPLTACSARGQDAPVYLRVRAVQPVLLRMLPSECSWGAVPYDGL